MTLCECGCGGEVNLGRRFIKGHHRRKPSIQGPKQLCNCGCGQVVGHVCQQFIQGHARKGKKLSEETKRKISKANKL